MAHQARAYSGFCKIKRLQIFLLPLVGMLVHSKLPQQYVDSIHEQATPAVCESTPENLLEGRYPFIPLGKNGKHDAKVHSQGSNTKAVVLFERDIIHKSGKLLNAIFISYKLYCKRCFHIYPRFWKQFDVALLDCV